MNNFNNTYFTGLKDPEAEEILRNALPQLSEDVKNAVNTDELGVFLGGGYGRGEGGVRTDSNGKKHLYNDIDFFVFTKELPAAQRESIHNNLKAVSKKWEKILGIDVDFAMPKNTSTLGKDAYTLMYQELKQGHVLIYGDETTIDGITDVPVNKISVNEGVRLLMNRGMGLLFASERLQNGEHSGFVKRNLNKAILGSGDAILISKGKYQWSIEDRKKALAEMQDILPENCVKLYTDACNFKYAPNWSKDDDLEGEWHKTRNLWLDAIRVFADVSQGASAKKIQLNLRNKSNQENHQKLKNILRWCIKTGSLNLHFPGTMTDYAYLRLLLKLHQIFFAADRLPDTPFCDSKLLKFWEKFN